MQGASLTASFTASYIMADMDAPEVFPAASMSDAPARAPAQVPPDAPEPTPNPLLIMLAAQEDAGAPGYMCVYILYLCVYIYTPICSVNICMYAFIYILYTKTWIGSPA